MPGAKGHFQALFPLGDRGTGRQEEGLAQVPGQVQSQGKGEGRTKDQHVLEGLF